MTLQMSQIGCGMNDWMELSGLGGLGMSEAAEVAEIRAKKAQVQAEIARLKGGGVPAAGGFRPQGSSLPVGRPVSAAPAAWPRVVGGVAVLGLGVYLVNRMMKKKRRR